MNKLAIILKQVLPHVLFVEQTLTIDDLVRIFETYKVHKSRRLQKRIKKVYFDDAEMLYYFANSFFKSRCEEFEEIISTSDHFSYFYAVDVIREKLPEDMHNKMIIYSMNDEGNVANWYFRYLKRRD